MFHPGPALIYPTTQRAFDVLERLATEPAGLPLTSLACELALPKSATHRLLLSLVDAGYVAQDALTQHYRPTFKMATLGFRLLAATSVHDVCQPVLDRLAAACGDLARLAVVDGDTLRWVAKAQGAHAGLRYDPEMGQEVALYATAVARLWLASLPAGRARGILARAWRDNRRALGPQAPRSLAVAEARMREVRGKAWAAAVEEGLEGVAAVGAVIRVPATRRAQAAAGEAGAGAVVGTVSITGPVARFAPHRRPVLGRLCVEAAAELAELWPLRGYQAQASTLQPAQGARDVHAA